MRNEKHIFYDVATFWLQISVEVNRDKKTILEDP
jgi:hypothetical protein